MEQQNHDPNIEALPVYVEEFILKVKNLEKAPWIEDTPEDALRFGMYHNKKAGAIISLLAAAPPYGLNVVMVDQWKVITSPTPFPIAADRFVVDLQAGYLWRTRSRERLILSGQSAVEEEYNRRLNAGMNNNDLEPYLEFMSTVRSLQMIGKPVPLHRVSKDTLYHIIEVLPDVEDLQDKQ